MQRWRGVRGEGATLTSAQNHQPNQHGTATQPPPHPRTTVRGSPANPPLAPVQRGRGVRGEGATLTNITTSHSPFTGRTDLRLQSPSYKNSCPFVFIRGSKTPPAKTLQDRSLAAKPELQKFVSIRVHSWFKKHPPRRPCRTILRLETPSYKNSCPFVFIRGSKNARREDPAGQISGWKARAAKIRAHSCSFVVQKHPRRRPFRADLGLESPSYKTSCPFVFIRGSKTPPAKTFQDRSQAGKPELQKFVSIRVHSWFKKHPPRRPCRTDLGLESRSYNGDHPRTPVRGSPPDTRHPTPDTRHPTPPATQAPSEMSATARAAQTSMT